MLKPLELELVNVMDERRLGRFHTILSKHNLKIQFQSHCRMQL